MDRLVANALSWFALTVAIVLVPGLTYWQVANVHEIGYVNTNQLDADLRYDVVETMGVSALVGLAAYLGVFVYLRRKGIEVSVREVFVGLNRYTFVLLAIPLLTAAMSRGIEVSHPLFTLALIAAATVIITMFIHRLRSDKPPLASGAPTTIHWALVAAAFTFYAGMMSYLAVLDHRNIGTHIFDLGIYDNIFWNTAFDDFLGCSYCKLEKHVSAHFDPIIWVWSWVYRLRPQAETLLLIQAIWLATTVFPVFLIAQRALKQPRLAVMMTWAVTLYPALHGVNMFDFHSLTLAVPTIVWVIYFIDSKSKVWLWIALAVLLATREDMSLLACFLGAYAVLRRRYVTGIAMVLVSMSYLAFVKLMIMPDPGLLMADKDTYGYAYFFKEMIPHQDEGVAGFVVSLGTNPTYAMQVLTHEDRVFFFLVLFQPLLFLPLLASKKRFMMLYGFLFLGLATRRYVYNLHFQYSSVLFPILLASTPAGVVAATKSRLPKLLGLDRRRVPHILLSAVLISTALISVKYGAMVPNDHFRAGWNRLSRRLDTERYEYVQELVAQIPDDAVVCATSALGPHVSSRDTSRKWPACKESTYALLATGRFKKKDKNRLKRQIRQGRLTLIDEGHGMGLYEREPETHRKPASKAPSRPGRSEKDEPRDEDAGGGETGEALNPHHMSPEEIEAREARAEDADEE
ncbi:MAG: DUF2079 domain-containing protein [Nannocystaceae bacterium]|nr:DUF2079 domain-containing protein [bacterium]